MSDPKLNCTPCRHHSSRVVADEGPFCGISSCECYDGQNGDPLNVCPDYRPTPPSKEELAKIKACAPLLPEPAPEVVIGLVRVIEELVREVKYLRHYGNKDCTAQADDAMWKEEME